MKLLRLSAMFAAVTGWVFLTGCSSSEFGSAKGDGPSAGAQKAAQGQDKGDEEDTDQNDGSQSTGDKDEKDDKDSELDTEGDTTASDYEADESTKGCQLPSHVREKFGSQGGKLGFNLQDWGGSGGADLKLTNLSLTDCAWFEKFKESDAVYIVQYDEKADGAGLTGEVVQSYAEPFNGKTAVEFAQCLTAAAAAGATCNRVGDL